MSDSDSDEEDGLSLSQRMVKLQQPLKSEPRVATSNGRKEDSSSDDDTPLAMKKTSEALKRKDSPVKSSSPAAKKIKPEPRASQAETKGKVKEETKVKVGANAKPSTEPKVESKPKKEQKAKKSAVPSDSDEDEEEDDDDDDDSDGSYNEKPSKKSSGKAKATSKPAPKAMAKQKRDGEQHGSNGNDHAAQHGSSSNAAWWEDDEVQWKRGEKKWTTLEHNGVLFPPLYEPHGKTFKYAREKVELTPAQEEVATMFAAMISTDYAKKEVFRRNFMESWKPLLKTTGLHKKITDLSKCDFSAIVAHLEALQAAKKDMTAEQKKKAKAEKDALEANFMYAVVDGQREKLGNFRVEPPGLFRGRGEHPKMGQLKARIMPEDVTLNLGENAPVPPVPDIGDGKAHKWGGVEHKDTVTWLAKWKDSINGEDKCVWLAANSSWKGKSDMAKYEKARELKQHIEKVRADYTAGFRSSDKEVQQRSVAVYLIDRLALRVGNEKNTDEEADTVGCCSLRVEHVKMDSCAENQLHLNFLGKDSITYDNTTDILPEVYQLIKKFMKSKKPEEELFDLVQPAELNDYFKQVMPGLSAKVFRTYNASITLCSELQKTADQVTPQQRQKEGDVNALYNYYQIANKNVAELCNHQKATPASHGAALAKMDEKIAKVTAEYQEARKAKNSTKMDSISKRLEKLKAERATKDELKNVSLGTSKINYNDPRITIAWCKRFDVPIQKPFPKTLLAKFAWAMGVEPDYKF
ncbi:hypothetical protein AB1Y20_000763 [Prymnesium parvum]|uniref:DNA topoisomerase 1 n=1 Tax=Prymnesium parvum TaxID=97485 RepID=A0AB34KAH0_PRYPA